MRILKLFFCCYIFISGFTIEEQSNEIAHFIVDPKTDQLAFFWKNKQDEVIGNFSALNKQLAQENKKLIFAMNGGMYQKDQSPLGLYIENGVLHQQLNKIENSFGNFYMQPNGVFAIVDDVKAEIVSTPNFSHLSNVNFATQSGPLLVHQGKMNSHFIDGSSNLNIRNGVGILPDGKILFAISKRPINFYDFAKYFIKNGCKNALYLDGYVSRAYIPSQEIIQTDGQFGVMIGVYENSK